MFACKSASPIPAFKSAICFLHLQMRLQHATAQPANRVSCRPRFGGFGSGDVLTCTTRGSVTSHILHPLEANWWHRRKCNQAAASLRHRKWYQLLEPIALQRVGAVLRVWLQYCIRILNLPLGFSISCSCSPKKKIVDMETPNGFLIARIHVTSSLGYQKLKAANGISKIQYGSANGQTHKRKKRSLSAGGTPSPNLHPSESYISVTCHLPFFAALVERHLHQSVGCYWIPYNANGHVGLQPQLASCFHHKG